VKQFNAGGRGERKVEGGKGKGKEANTKSQLEVYEYLGCRSSMVYTFGYYRAIRFLSTRLSGFISQNHNIAII